MINKIHIENYKIFDSFTSVFNNDLNIIVGDNESGKSTILEAINLVLTKRINGRLIDTELTPYYFNKKCVEDYLNKLASDHISELPKILIEIYLSEAPELNDLRGTMNTDKSDSIGIKLEIVFDEDYKEEYAKLIESKPQIKVIPTEYYQVCWYSFANKAITARSLPIGLSYIDAAAIRLQSGADYYLQNIINSGLDTKERVALSIAYRSLKEAFSNEASIKAINAKLTNKKGAITDKDLALSIDISQKSNWEANLIPHLDELPFQFIGKGEQNALKIMLALERQADDAHVILIEEPENHLSFTSLNMLLSKINAKCEGKQIFIATHSAYVLNELGIEKVVLLNGRKTFFLNKLPIDTQNYFKKLSGYDTLRLILAKKTILVEGPSDELIVKKAYLLKYNKLPIEDGVDVVNIRGLSFSRFLDISKELKNIVAIITDNDKDYNKNVIERYRDYADKENISIFSSSNNSLTTLELNILNCNNIFILNKVFGTSFVNAQLMENYMLSNKTECALKLFETLEAIILPQYVQDAIS